MLKKYSPALSPVFLSSLNPWSNANRKNPYSAPGDSGYHDNGRNMLEMNNTAPLMRENEEDLENAEGNGRDGKEIHRGKLLAVIFQKGAPSLRGRFWLADNVLGDGCLRDIDFEFQQFAMKSRSSPEGIIFAHGADELANIFGNPWPS
jgi:hypothetical protein